MQKTKIQFFIGILTTIFSIYLYIINSSYWFFPAPIGIWLIFGFLSKIRGNQTIAENLTKKNYKKFLKIYGLLFLGGLIVELIGMNLLKLWGYSLNNYETSISSLIQTALNDPIASTGFFIYPFILLSFREMYLFLKSLIKKEPFSTITAMVLGIIIWEIPNIFTKDWVYTIPYIHFEIFHINIVVIIGWIILIQAPNIICNFILRKK